MDGWAGCWGDGSPGTLGGGDADDLDEHLLEDPGFIGGAADEFTIGFEESFHGEDEFLGLIIAGLACGLEQDEGVDEERVVASILGQLLGGDGFELGFEGGEAGDGFEVTHPGEFTGQDKGTDLADEPVEEADLGLRAIDLGADLPEFLVEGLEGLGEVAITECFAEGEGPGSFLAGDDGFDIVGGDGFAAERVEGELLEFLVKETEVGTDATDQLTDGFILDLGAVGAAIADHFGFGLGGPVIVLGAEGDEDFDEEKPVDGLEEGAAFVGFGCGDEEADAGPSEGLPFFGEAGEFLGDGVGTAGAIFPEEVAGAEPDEFWAAEERQGLKGFTQAPDGAEGFAAIRGGAVDDFVVEAFGRFQPGVPDLTTAQLNAEVVIAGHQEHRGGLDGLGGCGGLGRIGGGFAGHARMGQGWLSGSSSSSSSSGEEPFWRS